MEKCHDDAHHEVFLFLYEKGNAFIAYERFRSRTFLLLTYVREKKK